MARHNELGSWGEQFAEDYLKSKGYTIVQRDWKFKHIDIDIIAYNPQQNMTIFVEVKTRTDDDMTSPLDAINTQKIKNLARAANAFIQTFNIESEVRFDVIAIVGTDKNNSKIEHIPEAFNPLLL